MKRKTAWELVNRRRPFGVNRGFSRQNVVIPVNRPRLRQPVRIQAVKGFQRSGGFYGRYGQAARDNGLVPESKFLDTALAFSFDTTGEVPATGQLALIPQGDTESTRDGRQCTITSIQIKALLYFVPGVTAATASEVSYLYLVQDTQCNGAAADISDVFTGNNFNNNMINLANSRRFRILKKWKYVWNAFAGAVGTLPYQSKSLEYFQLCNIPMEYSGTTGAIGEIRSNNIFLLAGGANFVDDGVTVQGKCRIRFRG